MIKHQKLASPSLVRKASLKANKKNTAPVVDIDEILGENNKRSASPVTKNSRAPDPPPEFANGSIKNQNFEPIDG